MNRSYRTQLDDDLDTALRPGRPSPRPYLLAASLIVVLGGVVVLGIAGPHTTPYRPAPATSAGATSLALRPSASPTPEPTPDSSYVPGPFATPDLTPVDGLTNLNVDAASVASLVLGSNVVPMSAYRANLLYKSGDNLFLANPTTSSTSQWIASVGHCGRITQAAMNASLVIFAQVAPTGSPQDAAAACPKWGPVAAWNVTIADVFSHETNQIASGTIVSSVAAWAQDVGPRVAIADGAYAFSRPDPASGLAVVEVRSWPEDLVLFRSDPLPGLTQLLLGDNRLVVVEDPTSYAGYDSPGGQQAVLSTGDWAEPLAWVGYSNGIVSLSRDGDRLAFASCDSGSKCQTIRLFGGTSPQEVTLPLGAGSVAVDSGDLDTVAWSSQTTPDDPTSYVGFRNARWPMSVALIGIAPPRWIYIQTDILMMVSVSAQGVLQLSELDLAIANLHV